MNKGPYVGYTYFNGKRHYLKIDGFFSFDIEEARRFQSRDEALSATRLDDDDDMIVFSDFVEETHG